MKSNSGTVSTVAALAVMGVLIVVGSACARGAGGETGSNAPVIKRVNASVIDAPPRVAYENSAVVLRGLVTGKAGTVRVDMPVEDDREPGKTEPWVYTEWNIAPTKIYKTDRRVRVGRPVKVALRGGTDDDLTVEFPGEARLRTGEDVVLFLIPSDGEGTQARGRYFTFAMAEGKYAIEGTRAVTWNEGHNTSLAELESTFAPRRGGTPTD